MQPVLFIKILNELSARYGVRLGEMTTEVYFDQLQNLSDDQLKEAFNWAISNCKFMPTPLQLFDNSGAGLETEALWNNLLDWSVRLNGFRYDREALTQEQLVMISALPDEVVDYINVNKISVVHLSNLNEFQLNSQKKSFINFLSKKTPKQKTVTN